MHGLKCAGAFPGWTRLCDEWLVGLEPLFAEDKSASLESPGQGARSVAVAAARTRRFAHGGELEDLPVDGEGTLRFELQGVDYVLRIDEWRAEPGADLLAGAGERLDALVASAKAASSADEHAVGLLFLVPSVTEGSTAGAEVEGFVEAFREATLTHALAYSFPESGAPFATPTRPGALLLARSAVFG